MKRGIGIWLVTVWLSGLLMGVGAAQGDWLYTDPKTQVTFSVPANWKQEEMSEERAYLDAKFVSDEGIGVLIYGSVDLWEKLPAQDKIGKTRAQINNSLFTKADVAEMVGVLPDKVETVTYGRATYFQAIIPTTQAPISITQLSCIHNGWFYTFQYSGTPSSSHYEEIQALLESVQYPGGDASAAVGGPASSGASRPLPFIVMLIVSLLITVLVYTVPVLIYRFGIRKGPLPRAKAKKFTVIYGILAFLVMSVLLFLLNGEVGTSSAILLWSMVNYKILTSDHRSDFPAQENRPIARQEPAAREECRPAYAENLSEWEVSPPSDPEVFCRECGGQLTEDDGSPTACETQAIREDGGRNCPACHRMVPDNSRFCPYCGQRIWLDDETRAKESQAHLEKAEAAYRGYREETAGTLFPGGVMQAANIIASLARIIQADLSCCDALQYARILSLYAYVQMRRTAHEDLLRMIQGLRVAHSELVTSERMAQEVLAACIIHAENSGFALSSEEDWHTITSLAEDIGRSAADAESNQSKSSAYIEDPEYGLVAHKPVCTRGIRGSQEYLSWLISETGEPLRWNHRGALEVQGIQGPVDVYDSFLPSGQAYQTVYIHMYAQETSPKAPRGFRFTQGMDGFPYSAAEEVRQVPLTCPRCGGDVDRAGKCPVCRRRRRRRCLWILLGILLTVGAAVLLGIFVVKPAVTYHTASNCLKAGEYDEAYALFSELGGYRDAAVMAKEVRYQQALLLLEDKNYDAANPILKELDGYKDSASRIHDHHHVLAEEKEPTCTQEGFDYYLCEGCGDSYFVTKEAKGHRYKEATCTQAAVCSVCKKTIRKALGHTTDDNECQRCGKVLFQKKTYSGTGPRRITGVKLPRGSYWVTMDFTGEGNFIVSLYGDGPDAPSSLLANTIGSSYLYGPVRIENTPVENGTIEVERAQGSWTITIEVL